MESLEPKYAVVDGYKVMYQSHGKGTMALVFVHGWTCNSSMWCLQAPLFRKYRLLLVDLPGHGNSEAPQVDYSQELLARAVEGVLQAEGVTKAVFIAHSMGGVVSTMVLRLFPERVLGIIYVDSFFRIPEHYISQIQRGERAQKLEDDDYVKSLLQYFWTPESSPELRSIVAKNMIGTPKHVRISASTTNSLPQAFRYDEIFQIPALLMLSLSSSRTFGKFDQFWLHHVPQLKVQMWKENGHFLYMEDPIRFNKEVEKFIADQGWLEDLVAN